MKCGVKYGFSSDSRAESENSIAWSKLGNGIWERSIIAHYAFDSEESELLVYLVLTIGQVILYIGTGRHGAWAQGDQGYQPEATRVIPLYPARLQAYSS